MKATKESMFRAFERTLFMLAVLHVLIVVIYALLTKQYDALSIGNILDFQLLFPSFEGSVGVSVILIILIGLSFIFHHYHITKPPKEDK